jgi:hypothetical protein
MNLGYPIVGGSFGSIVHLLLLLLLLLLLFHLEIRASFYSQQGIDKIGYHVIL